MDFSENFACQSVDEIQSAYWNATTVTLHPVVVYYKVNEELKHKNYVFVSDLQQHNATAVVAIIEKLVPIVKATVPGAVKLHYFTDSPTSQYRNRSIFDILCRHQELFGTQAVWNYMEAGHGKGPCDGIGGVAKRQASEAVRQGKVNIQDATDFMKWTQAFQPTSAIKYVFYTTEDYARAEALLKQRVTSPVTGTLKAHAVVPVSGTEVCINRVSCYCGPCLEGNLCAAGWERHTVVSKQTSNTSLVQDLHTVYPVSSFIIAKYDGDVYIAKVLGHRIGEVHLSFMEESETKSGITYKWPQPEDVMWRPADSVVFY